MDGVLFVIGAVFRLGLSSSRYPAHVTHFAKRKQRRLE